MNKAEATKFFLLFNLAIADKKIDPKEYELLSRYSKNTSISDIKREDIDYNSLISLSKEQKAQFYIELVDMMCCDSVVSKEELVLCGMIGEVMGADPEKCRDMAELAIKNQIKLKDKIAKGFISFAEEYDHTVNKPIKFINDFFKTDDINKKMKNLKILIFGSNENLRINNNEIIDLFNKTFISLNLPDDFNSKNFKFYIDKYSKIKKISNNVINSIQNNEFDYAIIGSKPHKMTNGFSGSWKESSILVKQINKNHIFENHQGFSKSYLKKVITQIGVNLGC